MSYLEGIKKPNNNVFVDSYQYLNMGMPPSKIWFKVNGGIVKDGQIEITHYALFLQNLQRLVNCLREVKYPQVNEAYFKLYSGRVYKSSHMTSISTIHQSTLDDDPIFNEINSDIEKLIRCLIEGDQEFVDALSDSIKDPGEKLKFLKSFKNLLSKKQYKISVGFLPEKPKTFIRIPSDRENFVDDLIKQYTSQASIEVYGVITRHKGDEPRNFVVTTTSGEKITCHYSEEMESYIHAHWKDPIFIKGIVSKSIRKNEMDQITSITPFNKVTMTQIGEFQLLAPLEVDIAYNKSENIWKLSADKIAIYGSGKTYEKANESFSDAFERLIVGIIAFKGKKTSQKSREIKEYLQHFIDFNQLDYISESVSFED